MTEETGRPVLKRSLGLFDATAIGLGAIIGAGVFVVIGPAVEVAGSAALLAIIIAGVVALLNALSSAQLAAAYPESGGTYVYGRRVINDLVGFAAGWVYVIGTIAADSAIVLTFAAYLDFLFPAVSAGWVAVAIVAAVTTLNYFGLRYSAGLNNILVIFKVGVLLFFIGVGAFAFNAARLPAFTVGGLGILHASAVFFFAYAGYARIATLGEEVKDPARTIPRAILTALGSSAVLYIGTLLAALVMIGPRGLAASNAPLAAAMRSAGFVPGLYAISFGALVATFSVFLTDLLGVSRMIFAMARNRDLPYWLSAVHQRYGSPHRSVLASGVIVGVLAALLPLRNLVEAGSFGLLVYYGITNLAALLLPSERRRYRRSWAAAGLLGCAALASLLPWRTIGFELLVIASGILYFLLIRTVSIFDR